MNNFGAACEEPSLVAPRWSYARIILGSVAGMVGVGAAVAGWFLTASPWWERALFLVGGLLLIDPAIWTDVLGLAIIAICIFCQYARRRWSARGQKQIGAGPAAG